MLIYSLRVFFKNDSSRPSERYDWLAERGELFLIIDGLLTHPRGVEGDDRQHGRDRELTNFLLRGSGEVWQGKPINAR